MKRFVGECCAGTIGFCWTNPVANRCPDEHLALDWFTLEQARQLPLADERYVQVFDSVLTR